MKPFASRPHPACNESPSSEAGFTLTELLAGLLVASLLIVGISQLTWRYARSSTSIRSEASSIQDHRMIATLFEDVALVDPGSLKVSSTDLTATLQGAPLTGQLRRISPTDRVLEWTSPTLQRSIAMPPDAVFEITPEGIVLLRTKSGELPLAVAIPKRSVPADCQFDTVIRECRP